MNVTSPAAATAGGYRRFSQVDWDHWSKVKAERRRLGIVRNTDVGKLLSEHPLAGKTVLDTTRGEAYRVESVKKDWHRGWFVTALLDCHGSHRVCVVENISSDAPEVLDQLAVFNDNFRQLQ